MTCDSLCLISVSCSFSTLYAEHISIYQALYHIDIKHVNICPPYSLPLITGVKTAMPAKFGLVTVLSRIKPPTLEVEVRVNSWKTSFNHCTTYHHTELTV